MMDLDELQSVRDRERQTDKLQQLRGSFYADAGEFIQSLREQREQAAERADDPFDAPEVSRLSDEIDTAEQTVEAIYEKRVGKIVKAASFAAADLPAETDGMTREEQDLFETLVNNIRGNRQHVLDVLAGETAEGEDASESADGATPDAVTDPSVSAADVMGESDPSTARGPSEDETDEAREIPPEEPGDSHDATPHDGGEGAGTTTAASTDPSGSDRATGESPSPGGDGTLSDESEVTADSSTASSEGTAERTVDRETVRITDDVGPIFGVDEREYDLSEDDVVQLPAANADPLVDRDAAERLD